MPDPITSPDSNGEARWVIRVHRFCGQVLGYRQGGTIYNTRYVTYPIAFKTVLCITANASNKTEAVNLYDITMTTVELHNNGGTPNFTKWLAFGM